MIDVKKEELILSVGTKEVHFNLNQSLKQHDVEQAKCMRINSVNSVCKEKNDDFMNKNSFDDYILNSLYNDDIDKEELIAKDELAGALLNLSEEKIDDLRSSGVKIQEEEKSSEGLILKELPKHLKYVFLSEEKSKPVIIAAYLIAEKEQKMVEIMRKHKEAIAWSIEDLKGINLSICMHKILMEENAKTSIV